MSLLVLTSKNPHYVRETKNLPHSAAACDAFLWQELMIKFVSCVCGNYLLSQHDKFTVVIFFPALFSTRPCSTYDDKAMVL